MAKKAISLPQVANPTIEAVIERFVENRTAGKGISKADKKGALELFMDSMNGYGHQTLSKEETKLFDRFYNLDGEEHKEFCQVFGPDKIAENVGEFVGYFLIRKVMLPGNEMGEAAAIVAAFLRWLVEKNIVPAKEMKEAIERAEQATKDLPAAEDANRLIWELAQKCPRQVEEFLDFGYMTIKRIEKDGLYLEPMFGEEVGPVTVPKKASLLVQPGWSVNCALARSGGKWHFAEVGNVYP